MRLARRLPAVLLATVPAVPAVALAADPAELPVVEHHLGNGLELLVLEDHDIPNATLHVGWRVGSRNEVPGITGLAHFFEHMMFSGGARYGKRFDTVMESAGGSNNAWTSNDTTVYTDWFPAAALPLIVDMEADRMSGMVFDPEVVGSERGVVASEWRLNMEVPTEVLREQLWAAAYTAHPYQWPVLGWKVDIDSWRQSDLEEFFSRNYAPNNCVVVVVGDVKADEVVALVERRMGSIPRRPDRRPVHTLEPVQRGERRVKVRDPQAQLPQVMAAWHMVATSHPDFAVYEILERLLLGGDSSRLNRLLVEDRGVCLEVGGGWQGHQFDPSLFVVETMLREGVDTAQVEDLVYGEIARLGAEGPTERELTKAKNSLRAAFVRRMKTLHGKAELLLETHTFFGGWRQVDDRLRAVEAVTAQDVKRIVGTALVATNRTVAVLEIGDAGEGGDK